MPPCAVDECAQGVERPDRPEGKRADLGVGRVQVGQQRGEGGEGGQRADGLAREERPGAGLCGEGEQPEGGDAPGGVRRPGQLPPSASPVSPVSVPPFPVLRLRPLPPRAAS